MRGVLDADVAVFRGVSYAEPAAGRLRYAAPVPKRSWHGALDATRDGSMPPQVESRVFWALGSGGSETGTIGEDCLNLTIWAPRGAIDAPVLFWIHGGAFTTGAGSWTWYDGQRLAAEQGIVVVTCNYRLGAFGYLFCDGQVPRNLGLLDQIEALRWVGRHIASFGGDPTNVTVAGQSAGAHSVVSMLQLPETEGLFHRAVIQSFPGGIPVRTADDAARCSDAFLESLGIDRGRSDVADRLRSLSIGDILQAQVRTAKALPPPVGDINPPFAPVEMANMPAGVAFLKSATTAAAARGIAVLIGWTRDEAMLFTSRNPAVEAMTEEGLTDYARRQFGSAADARLSEAREHWPEADAARISSVLMTDAVFRDGTLDLADELVANGVPTFVYRFDWQPPSTLGACHCVELPFVFGNPSVWDGTAMMGAVRPEELEPLVKEVQRRWASFIRNGDPGARAWNTDERELIVINEQISVSRIETTRST